MAIDPKFIVDLKGKPFVLFVGLLDHAHKNGLRSIESKLIQIPTPENGMMAIVHVTATFASADGFVCWSAYGDASPENTGPMVRTALLRMAETRGAARVLRFSTNVGMTTVEEVGEEEMPGRRDAPVRHEQVNDRRVTPNVHSAAAEPARGATDGVASCEVCHGAVSKNEQTASQHHFKRDLCRTHFAALRQQAETHNKQPTT